MALPSFLLEQVRALSSTELGDRMKYASTVALLFVSFQVALLGQPEQWVSPSQGRPADSATAQQSEHSAGSGPETQGEAGVLRVGGDVSAPKLASQVRPEYSQEAAVSLYEGTAVLSVVVQPHGTVRDIKVVKPLGLGLDERAVETVKQWRFQPAKKNSKPVAVQVNVEVDFRLFDPADFESTKRIAERGDAFGQESLGVAYQLGRGTCQNSEARLSP